MRKGVFIRSMRPGGWLGKLASLRKSRPMRSRSCDFVNTGSIPDGAQMMRARLLRALHDPASYPPRLLNTNITENNPIADPTLPSNCSFLSKRGDTPPSPFCFAAKRSNRRNAYLPSCERLQNYVKKPSADTKNNKQNEEAEDSTLDDQYRIENITPTNTSGW